MRPPLSQNTPNNARFFIVGCGRSGSTLLRLLLCGHSRLYIPPETWFIQTLVHELPATGPLSGNQSRRALEIITSDYRWPDFGLSAEELSISFGHLESPSLRDVIDVVYDALLRNSGRQRLGDKTPPYIAIVPELAILFPDARFIHLIRDGRDVARSFAELGFATQFYDGPRFEWTAAVRLGARYKSLALASQILEVKYEDLVANPEMTLRKICSFLGEDFEMNMIRAERHADLIPERERAIHPKVTEPISNDDAQAWRHKVSPAECFIMEACLGSDLGRLGYPLRYGRAVWRPLLALTALLIKAAAPALNRARAALRRRNLISRNAYI